MALDDKMLDALTPALKGAGLSNEVAQQLATALVKYQDDSAKESETAAANQRKEWVGELRKDPQFQVTVDNGRRAVALAGKDAGAVRDILNATGMGDHPAIVRWLANLGSRLSETPFIPGQAPAGSAKDKTMAQLMYSGTTQP